MGEKGGGGKRRTMCGCPTKVGCSDRDGVKDDGFLVLVGGGTCTSTGHLESHKSVRCRFLVAARVTGELERGR